MILYVYCLFLGAAPPTAALGGGLRADRSTATRALRIKSVQTKTDDDDAILDSEIITFKVHAHNQNDLNAGFQIVISWARSKIFSFRKKFLKVHQKLYTKQPKNDF